MFVVVGVDATFFMGCCWALHHPKHSGSMYKRLKPNRTHEQLHQHHTVQISFISNTSQALLYTYVRRERLSCLTAVTGEMEYAQMLLAYLQSCTGTSVLATPLLHCQARTEQAGTGWLPSCAGRSTSTGRTMRSSSSCSSSGSGGGRSSSLWLWCHPDWQAAWLGEQLVHTSDQLPSSNELLGGWCSRGEERPAGRGGGEEVGGREISREHMVSRHHPCRV